MDNMEKKEMTMTFAPVKDADSPETVILRVYEALKAKGYDPINQLVGYIISGDPTYITSYDNARVIIRRIDRDELLEEVVAHYIRTKLGE